MKKHLVEMHCGQQMSVNHPAQRFCNRRCAGYFVSRRPGAKKRNRNLVQDEKSMPSRPGSSDPLWANAKRYLNKRGYVVLVVYDPDLKASFQRLEHVVVWEKYHGTMLPQGWVVHHVNQMTDDNDPRNLLALPNGLHRELHVQLELLAGMVRGPAYVSRSNKLTQECSRRSTRLADLRRHWHVSDHKGGEHE